MTNGNPDKMMSIRIKKMNEWMDRWIQRGKEGKGGKGGGGGKGGE